MINLVFMYNREVLNFIVDGKIIYYSDRRWKTWLQCMPEPKDFIMKIRNSRNVFPAFLANLFKYSKEELAEYEAAKDEDALADIIIKDAKLKGCILVKRQMIDKESLKGGK